MQNHSEHHNNGLLLRWLLSCMVLVTLLSVGCNNTTKPVKPSEHLTCIATVGGSDSSTQQKIKTILEANGVVPMFEGSVVYGVYVRDGEASKALQLLKSADTLKGVWIEFQPQK